MQTERSYTDIHKEELEEEVLMTMIETANTLLQDSPIYTVGDNLKKDKQYKGECFQRIIKEAYQSYNGKCKIPEVRFLIFDSGNCIMNVVGNKRFR